LAVHIYGLSCNLKELEDCCKNHTIPLVYDAAQAFGSKLADKSLLSFGNYSICSFHATKIFHTGEGGCIVCHSRDDYEHLSKIRAFGHVGDEHYQLGINGKMSEIHAAMGLALLQGTAKEIEKRKQVHSWYEQTLRELQLNRPSIPNELDWNYGYYPILLSNESTRLLVEKKLKEKDIHPRRYFYPALNTLPYLKESWRTPCPVAEDAARRVLCLPMYGDLSQKIVMLIADCIQKALNEGKL
ncbi:MAG: DegT/DnrJ/EryC1/StrS family aminotransferase, partial [Desulfovibrio sp.]|nr:DegT/DnrJ/EryC1/StrS family aminotransferase [Desulfovibrio sp.]